jgi:hypothetical protein
MAIRIIAFFAHFFFALYLILSCGFEVRHPRCVLNHSVENEYEKTVINTSILYLYS